MSRPAHVIASLPLLLALGGCATNMPGSVAGGECKLTHTPEYQVLGKAPYDQAWINRTTEALVDGCGQPRPIARPAGLDAPVPTPKARPATPPKKKSLLRRLTS